MHQLFAALKSSPALYEQRKQLERAKTVDILKAKIQQRPDRQELERRHILEHDESHVDPSLAERQRMLKKARLADQLNSQLSHRPGPLELIKKNILRTEEPIERIVKEGLISFKATSEGLLTRPQHPNGYTLYEDDSQSSEGDQQNSPSGGDDMLEISSTSAKINVHEFVIPVTTENVVTPFENRTQIQPPPIYTPIPIPLIPASEPFQVKPETSNLFAELCQSVIDNNSTLNFVANFPSTGTAVTTTTTTTSVPTVPPQIHVLPSQCLNNKSDAPGKDKNRKKNKMRPIAKARTIKFHEYKGPPNAQKNGLTSLTSEETSYQILLKQQNCLLEYLEGLNKNPSNNVSNAKAAHTETFPVTSNFLQQPQISPASSTMAASPLSNFADSMGFELAKLEKMKVSDLKLLLKTHNLPVSGPKPQLIERLRPYIQNQMDTDTSSVSNGFTADTCDFDNMASPQKSPSIETADVDMYELPPQPKANNDDLLRKQQRKIDELQRKLRESQQELQQMKQIHPPLQKVTAEIIQNKPEALNQKQIFKKQLEAKIQKEKLQKMEHQQKIQLEQQLAYQQKKEQGNEQMLFLKSTHTLTNTF